MHSLSFGVLLSTLINLQQVSGRVVATQALAADVNAGTCSVCAEPALASLMARQDDEEGQAECDELYLMDNKIDPEAQAELKSGSNAPSLNCGWIVSELLDLAVDKLIKPHLPPKGLQGRAENECDRARTLLAQMPNGDTPTQIDRPPTAKMTEMTVVDICKNDPLNPPCTTVDAPYGECVKMPADYQEVISGVKPHKSSAVCRFYSGTTCKGQYFEVNKGTSLVGGKAADAKIADLQQPPSAFNDKVGSVKCSPEVPEPPPSDLRWIWSSKTQPELCARLDQLSFDFQIGDANRAGTYDIVKMDFGGAGVAPHVIAKQPATSAKISGKVDMVKTFGKKTVALDSIQTIRILDQEIVYQSGDGWDLKGFKLQGRCAGSGLMVYLDKFYPLDKTLQVDTTGDGSDRYSKDWEVWSGDVKVDDWATRPLCSHFKEMSVSLQMSGSLTSGTNNALYANVGRGKFLIVDESWRGQQYNVRVDLQKAYKSKDVAVTKVGNVGISSEGGYNDRAGLEVVNVYGECAGAEGSKETQLSVMQTFSEWLYDGEKFTVDITPDKWVKK